MMGSCRFPASKTDVPLSVDNAARFIKDRLLPLGLFIQLTGILWIGSNNGYEAIIYIVCLLPALLSASIDVYRLGLVRCFHGFTVVERVVMLLLLWIFIHPLFVSEGKSFSSVANRVIAIGAYFYCIRTVLIRSKRPERMLLWAVSIAVFFAVVSIIYNYVVIDRDINFRIMGGAAYRLGGLGIGGFAVFKNVIFAALYYGVFGSIMVGYLSTQHFCFRQWVMPIMGVAIFVLFILLSGSQGPLLSFFIMAAIALIFCDFPNKKRLFSIVTVIAVALVFILLPAITALTDRMITTGFNYRWGIWSSAVEQIFSQPFIGHGAYANQRDFVFNGFQHPHNMILNIAYYWGIPAAFLYILSVVIGMIKGWQLRSLPLMSIASCVLVFGAFGMITDTYSFISHPNEHWLLFYFPIAMVSAAIKRRELGSVKEAWE